MDEEKGTVWMKGLFVTEGKDGLLFQRVRQEEEEEGGRVLHKFGPAFSSRQCQGAEAFAFREVLRDAANAEKRGVVAKPKKVELGRADEVEPAVTEAAKKGILGKGKAKGGGRRMK